MGMFRIVTDVSKLMFNINIPDLTKLMLKEARWKIKNKKKYLYLPYCQRRWLGTYEYLVACVTLFLYIFIWKLWVRNDLQDQQEQLHIRMGKTF